MLCMTQTGEGPLRENCVCVNAENSWIIPHRWTQTEFPRVSDPERQGCEHLCGKPSRLLSTDQRNLSQSGEKCLS